MVLIFQKRNKHPPPPITVEFFDERIPRTEQATLLGITYDSKFTFEAFLQKLTTKFNKKLTLMYKLRGTNWGASSHTLTKFYKAYIRPTLEYAAPILLCLTKTRKKDYKYYRTKHFKLTIEHTYKLYTTKQSQSSSKQHWNTLQKKLALEYNTTHFFKKPSF